MANEHFQNEHNLPHNSSEPGYTGFTPISNDNNNKTAPNKHSGLGISSFILALVSMLGLVIAFIVSVAAAAQFINVDPVDIQSSIMEGGEELSSFIGAGLLMLLAICISFIGLLLGIIGIFIKNRKKVFSIIGTALNGLIVIGTVLMMAIGASTSIS